jgi:predicted N-acyltransferase
MSYSLPSMRALGTGEQAEWLEILRRTRKYDFHHLPQYHRVAERRGEGEARLFVYQEADCTIAVPLLLRPIEDAEEGWFDATSVYGYGGPVTSHDAVPPEVIANFRGALAEALSALRVVSLFSRLHPLIEQQSLIAGLGECPPAGATISIDLRLPEAEQIARYNKSCRTSLRKLGEMGFVGVHDREKRYLREFAEVYRETMRRAHAHESYFFGEDYFRLLTEELGEASHLFVALKDGEVAAATLCTLCDGIVQDHLGGTRDAFLKFSPDRLVVHTERKWAREMGARDFHLGGGVGAQEDSVFRYKSGFSPRRHVFSTWRWIIQPGLYAELTEARARWNRAHGTRPISDRYFPAYRCPSAPVALAETPAVVQPPAMRVIAPHDVEEWTAVLQQALRHDIYFLPGYHAVSTQGASDEAQMFVYREAEYMIALPLVVRRVEFEQASGPCQDATSVYGYAGPLFSHASFPDAVLRNFREALTAALRERKVVAVFSRLHPLLRQKEILAQLGECRSQGDTISIDLTQPLEVQRAGYSGTVKTRLNRLRREGVTGERDAEKQCLSEFIAIYCETMQRVGASAGYFFEDSYFTGLAEKLGETLQLFVVRLPDGTPISAGLFTLCDGMMQYHLGGTRTDALKFSPMTLLLDTARLWAAEQQARVFHIGGGVGAQSDSLFQFKAGFSPRRHEFLTWRWILEPDRYRAICDERQQLDDSLGLEPATADYFPAYRAPRRPRPAPAATEFSARAALLAHHG